MTATHVALLRGINVGRAKRIKMADLRALVAGLGYGEVRTLLASGNVVFTAPGTDPAAAAARLEGAVAERAGFTARVAVLTADELAAAVRGNPLAAVADDPTRLLVSVPVEPGGRDRLVPLLAEDWSPGALALGARVAYLWCPAGILDSPLAAAVERTLPGAVTARNQATMEKLLALAGG